MHRDAKLRPQIFRKRLGLSRLRTLVPGHIQRIPYNDLRNPMLPQHTTHRLEIGPAVGAVQRKQRLRRIAQRVGDSEADPPVPHIEPHYPRHQAVSTHALSVRRPCGCPTLSDSLIVEYGGGFAPPANPTY